MRAAVMLHDLAWLPVSIYLAFALRFNLEPLPSTSLDGLKWMIVLALPIFAATFWSFGLHRGTWRFVSVPDLVRIVKSVLLGVLAMTLAIFILRRLEGVPRSVFVLFPLILAQGLSVPRLLTRWVMDRRISLGGAGRTKTLIVGAGTAGEAMLRNIVRSGRFFPVALVDPNPAMLGREIHGVRVLGGIESIPAIVQRTGADLVVLALPEISVDNLNRVLELSAELGLPCQTLPRADQTGRLVVDVNQLRPVRIEDLLSRDPVVLDRDGQAQLIAGKCVLVTGGGGSIGSELCRQTAALRPGRLIILDHGEFALYQIEQEIAQRYPDVHFEAVLCDVKDRAALDDVFTRTRPQIVFHAAAYKHVPLLENNARPAVMNNVFGTIEVARAADRHGCAKFVLVSTDKAVNPTNVMGASKRIAEIFCQNFNGHSLTRFITTRFGNVLGSNGSVVPIFEAQIARGGPVTVTHPDIERFFMTIPEAVGLILQSAAVGTGGEIFVLEMGSPVRIKELAEQMIRLAGLRPYKDIPIVFTGLRPGEKLFEEIFHPSEGLIGTGNRKLLLAAFRKVDWDGLARSLDELQRRVWSVETGKLLEQIKSIVPEFNVGVDLNGKEKPAPPGHMRVVT
ncbi:MAG: polysaccharide biosynthesis protein [Candidatus Lambdaproteobacteria bacterium]|nr:polysaccharide biosynthesis protein [Candidatus Lambdaproteobacteria bacterium]